jgi:hypothetical protein
MSIIAAAAARQASTAAIAVNTSAELTRARALADGGVRAGWTAFADGRVNNPASFWGCRSGEDVLLVRIRPETSRIDINLAEPELLAALFAEAGADRATAERLAAAAVEYRNFGEASDGAGDVAGDMPGAPEAEAPADDGAGRLPDGVFVRGPFQSIEELGYLPGMDAALFRRIAGDITVHARTTDVNPRYASRQVRVALESVGMAVEPASEADGGESAGFEGSLMDVRAIGVTRSGAVFVREAVVEGPIGSEGAPSILRVAQGRLGDDEVLPDGRGAPACTQGFAAVGRAQ